MTRIYHLRTPDGWPVEAEKLAVASVSADAMNDTTVMLRVYGRGGLYGALYIPVADEEEITGRLLGEERADTPDREAFQVLMDELQDVASAQSVDGVIAARRRLLAAFDALRADATEAEC